MSRRDKSTYTMIMGSDAFLPSLYLHHRLLLLYDEPCGIFAIEVQYPDKYEVGRTRIQKESCVRGLTRHLKTLREHLAGM